MVIGGRKISDQTLRLAVGYVLAAVALAVFYLLTHVLLPQATGSVDEYVRARVVEFGTPCITVFFLAVTRLGSTVYLTVVGVTACISFIALRWTRELGLFLACMTGQIILHNGAKAIFRAERPATLFDYPDVAGYSFPSGHALSSFVVYIVLTGLIVRHFRSGTVRFAVWLSAASLVLVIGMSRVYLGMHYLSDVLAGFTAAAIWAAAVLISARSREPRDRSTPH